MDYKKEREKELSDLLTLPENKKILIKLTSDVTEALGISLSALSGTLNAFFEEHYTRHLEDTSHYKIHPLWRWKHIRNVKNKVSSLLGIDLSKYPIYFIFSNASDRSFVISMDWSMVIVEKKESSKYMLPTVLAHEFAHISNRLTGHEDWGILGEGFARGVERAVARQYAAKKADAMYMRGTNIITAVELYSSVLSMAKSLVDIPGYPIFGVAEAKHGDCIYRELLHSKKPYEMLVGMLGGRR